MPQRVDFIIDVADRIKKCTNIIFLLIGEGTEKEKIKNLIKIKKLNNVILIDLIPQDDYINLTKQCDVGLVNLSEKFTITNIQSRALSYWEAKIPILAAIDSSTDFCSILEQSGSGLSSISGDINSYIQNFEKLYYDSKLRSLMGNNGYNYLLENCTTSIAYSIITDKLLSAGL